MATKKSQKKPPVKPKRGRPALFPRPTAVLVKMDKSDLSLIKQAAKRDGVKVSAWMRETCIAAAERA